MSGDILTPEAVSDLALVAIDATARPGSWDHLCDLVANHIDAAAFMVFAYNVASPSMPIFHGSHRTRTPIAIALRAEVQAGGGEEDHASYEALARAEPGAALQEGELLGLARGSVLPENGFRDRILKATQGKARSIMRVNDHGPFLDVAVAHENASFDVGPPAMARLMPHLGALLARTLESSRVVSALTAGHARLMALFDCLDFGAAFSTPEGRILTANPAFCRIVAERDGLRNAAQTLAADDPAGMVRLRDALAAAVQPAAAADQLTVTLPRPSGRLPLVLRAVPVRERDLGPATTVLVLVIDPEDGDRLDASGLAAFGILTPAELEVCDLLVRGHETPGIAERRGTGLETARDQIKSAAAKLACRSRLDLVRLAMAARAPVRET